MIVPLGPVCGHLEEGLGGWPRPLRFVNFEQGWALHVDS